MYTCRVYSRDINTRYSYMNMIFINKRNDGKFKKKRVDRCNYIWDLKNENKKKTFFGNENKDEILNLARKIVMYNTLSKIAVVVVVVGIDPT